MSKASKILILSLAVIGMSVFSLSVRDLQGAVRNEPPVFVKQEPAPKAPRPLYVPDEIIVKFKPQISANSVNSFLKDEGVVEKYESKSAKFKVLKIPATKNVPQLVEIFKKSPLVEYAEPNYYRYAFWHPNDPLYRYQWNFDDDHTNNPGGAVSNPYGGANGGGIGMENTWPITSGTSSIVVAIIDTGIAYENYGVFKKAPDLANTCFANGYDYINNDSHPNDDNGHGTHVAGTVAQSTNNGEGVAGIAFGVCLMPVKVLDKFGNGDDVSVSSGVHFAVDNGAKVINLSLGGPNPSATLEEAMNYAYTRGVTVIAAAGNDGIGTISYPAAYDDYVIAVGATRYDEQKADYSNYGKSLDIVAPGGQVCVDSFVPECLYNDQNGDDYPDGVLQQTFGSTPTDFGYWFFDGTSMATPHVAGVAALLKSKKSDLTPDQIRNILQTTAEDKGAAGWDSTYGWGLIDAYAALLSVPAVSITLTTNGSVDFGIAPLEATRDNLGDAQTVRVDTGPADLNIKSTVFSNGTSSWALGGSNGDNQVIWEYSKEGTTWNKFLLANTPYLLATGTPQSGTQNFYLRLTLPTAAAVFTPYNSTVTIMASQP